MLIPGWSCFTNIPLLAGNIKLPPPRAIRQPALLLGFSPGCFRLSALTISPPPPIPNLSPTNSSVIGTLVNINGNKRWKFHSLVLFRFADTFLFISENLCHSISILMGCVQGLFLYFIICFQMGKEFYNKICHFAIYRKKWSNSFDKTVRRY